MILKNNEKPLYIQLAKSLKNLIIKIQPHDKMISERQICHEYNVSRTTVRLALVELENSGYIYKKQGSGTFVTGLLEGRQNLMESFSFTDYTKKIGKEPKTIILSFEIVAVNSPISKQMGLKNGEDVYKLERIRLADLEPMMLEISYLPIHLFPNLSLGSLSAEPLYEIFKNDYNQKIKFSDEQFSSGLITNEEAGMLGVDSFTHCLRIKRISYNQKNIVVEYTISVARGDKFIYSVRHSN